MGISKIVILDALTYAGNMLNIEDSLKKSYVEFIHGSINDSELVRELVKEVDVVVNFAAESHVDNSIDQPMLFWQTNVLGTLNLLEAVRNQKKIRFLQVSTDEVYGSVAVGQSKETDLLQPSSPYSASKAAADLAVLAYSKTYGLDIVITRCSNNFGTHQYPEKLIPRLIYRTLESLPLPIYGNGSNRREWIHVEDHCRAIALVLEKGSRSEIYNVGSDEEYNNVQIAQFILEASPTSKSRIEFVTDRLGHDFRYRLDSSKIVSQLGFMNQRGLRIEIPKMLAWFEQHKDRTL